MQPTSGPCGIGRRFLANGRLPGGVCGDCFVYGQQRASARRRRLASVPPERPHLLWPMPRVPTLPRT